MRVLLTMDYSNPNLFPVWNQPYIRQDPGPFPPLQQNTGIVIPVPYPPPNSVVQQNNNEARMITNGPSSTSSESSESSDDTVAADITGTELPSLGPTRRARPSRWYGAEILRSRPTHMASEELAQEFFDSLPVPAGFQGEGKLFQKSGCSWLGHIVHTYNWERALVSNPEVHVDPTMMATGCRIICMDLHDYVACPDVYLSNSRFSLDLAERETVLKKQFLLVAYSPDESGTQWVTMVYDKGTQAAFTFDGKRDGRFRRHEGAVKALEHLFEDSDLHFGMETAKSMAMSSRDPHDSWANGYLALEGARVFLREARGEEWVWRDWVDSVLYWSSRYPDAGHIRDVWLQLLREELAHAPELPFRSEPPRDRSSSCHSRARNQSITSSMAPSIRALDVPSVRHHGGWSQVSSRGGRTLDLDAGNSNRGPRTGSAVSVRDDNPNRGPRTGSDGSAGGDNRNTSPATRSWVAGLPPIFDNPNEAE